MAFVRFEIKPCPINFDIIWSGRYSLLAITTLERYKEVRDMILTKETTNATEIQLIKPKR